MLQLLQLWSVFALASHSLALVVEPKPSPRSVLVASELASTPCLADAYHGSYGGSKERTEHVYLPPRECLTDLSTSGLLGDLNVADVQQEGGRIVWVGLAGLDPSLVHLDMTSSWTQIQSLAASSSASKAQYESGQHAFSTVSGVDQSISLIRQSDHSLLLHVPDEYVPILDTLLPAHLVPVALPSTPLRTLAGDAWTPVPRRFAEHLGNITKHLRLDPLLGEVLDKGLQMDKIRRDVRWLTGEAPSGIESRHSFTPGAIKAANWIKEKVETSGAVCDLHHYMPGFSPNVICTYPSLANSDEHVILSAHYDSRGSFGNTRAPGGDDDGSGTGHLLAVVEAIKEGRVKFEKKVQVAFFSGEEQGLYGSHAYAEFLHNTNETVILHIQADMLGYHGPGEPMQLGLPESIGTPEAAYLLGNLSHIYSPELVVGRTSACCSDHQSFHAYGFPATQVFERNGWILDPMYHNSGDVSQREGYDFDQIVSIAKVTMSALLTVGGYKVEVDID